MLPQKPHPTRLWATRDVDRSVVLVQDGEAGIRSVSFADPFAEQPRRDGSTLLAEGARQMLAHSPSELFKDFGKHIPPGLNSPEDAA